MSQNQSLETSLKNTEDEATGASKKSPLLSLALNIFKIAFTAGILIYVYKNGLLDLSRIKTVLSTPSVVISALLIVALTNILSVFRWQKLLAAQELPLKYFEAFKLSMIGVFFNTAIPGAVSGDLIKGYYIVRKQPEKKGKIRAFTSLLLDRILGLSALVFVSTASMLFNFNEMATTPKLKPLIGLISLICAGVLAFYALILMRSQTLRKFQERLQKLPFGDLAFRFFEAIKLYENQKPTIFLGLMVSMAIHISLISAFIFLARSLGGFESVPADKFFLLVPLGLLVTAIPVAPAGLGTGHAAFLGLFQLVGSQGGADLFTAYVSIQIFFSLIGGVFYIRFKSQNPNSKAER